MPYMFQKGLPQVSSGQTSSTTRYSTDWIYPVQQTSTGSQQTTQVKREVSSNVGYQPANGTYAGNRSFSLPNSYSPAPFEFKVGRHIDSGITNTFSDTITLNSGSTGRWVVNSLAQDDDNCILFNQNTTSYNTEVDSDWLVARFDLSSSIPEGAIIKSIQLKVDRKSFAFNDKDLGAITGDDIIPGVDDFLINNNITTYTRDGVISFVSDFFAYTGTTSGTTFDNMSQAFTPESTSITTFSTGYTYGGKTLQLSNLSSNLVSYVEPRGTWSGNREVVIYGGNDSSTWGINQSGATELLRSGKFGLRFNVKQKVFRGYGFDGFYNPQLILNKFSSGLTFNDISKGLNWDTFGTKSYLRMLEDTYTYRTIGSNSTLVQHYNYRNTNNYYDISLPLASYMLSRVYSVAVKVHYEVQSSGFPTTFDDRSYGKVTSYITKTNDLYFKNQKCFDGVCYKYTTSLSNIYTDDTRTTNSNGINNMYTEYNIIDKYMPNSFEIDYAVTDNIDTGATYYSIDSSVMKPGHMILLTGQDDPVENDLYTVSDNYKLVLSDKLSNPGTSYKSKFTVKYGTSSQLQYFLRPFPDDTFPVSVQEKTFDTGHSYIIKNLVNYNIDNTSSFEPCRLLMTDYQLARTLNSDTIGKFSPVRFNVDSSTTNVVTVKYRDMYYTVSDTLGHAVSALTYSINSSITTPLTGGTLYSIPSSLYNDMAQGDYIQIDIFEGSGATNDTMKRVSVLTQVDNLFASGSTRYMTTTMNIDPYVLSTIRSYVSWTCKITNLNKVDNGSSIATSIINSLNKLPLSELMSAVDVNTNGSITTIEVSPKTNDYSYFNYGDVTLSINGTGMTFNTSNQYASYELKPFIDRLVELEFGSGTTLPVGLHNSSSFTPTQYTSGYTDNNLYITPKTSYRYKLNNFEPHTFVRLSDGATSAISMIRAVTTSGMTLDLPVSGGTATYITSPTISNIYDTGEISDMLMKVYINTDDDWYKSLNDSDRNRVCAAYAGVISKNSTLRELCSGILYQESDRWNLDIFKLGFDETFHNTFDKNMVYQPCEVIDVGKDRITKLPKVIDIGNITVPTDKVYAPLTGCTIEYNGTIQESSYLYAASTWSGGTMYTGAWNDRVIGSSFTNKFTYYDASVANRFGMLVLVGTGFTQDSFYRTYITATSSPAGPNTLTVDGVQQAGDTSHVTSHVSSSNLGSYTFNYTTRIPTSTTTFPFTTSTGLQKSIFTGINLSSKTVSYCVMLDGTHQSTITSDGFITAGSNDVKYYTGGTLMTSNTNTAFTYANVCNIDNNAFTCGKKTSTNTLFVASHDKDLTIKSVFDTGTSYKTINKMISHGDNVYVLYIDSSNRTNLLKLSRDLTKEWNVTIGTGANTGYDMAHDGTNIYVTGSYTGELYLGDSVHVDSPLGKTYSMIIEIDDHTGMISGALNIVSTDSIVLRTVLDLGEYLEVSGYCKGQTLVNRKVISNQFNNYIISRIKKSDIK